MLSLLVSAIALSALRLAACALYFKGFVLLSGPEYIAAPALQRTAYALQLGIVLVFAWL